MEVLRGEKFINGKTNALFSKPFAANATDLQSTSIVLPFTASSLGARLDVENLTWAQLGWDSTASVGIRIHALKEGLFTASGFNASTWPRKFPGWPERDVDKLSDDESSSDSDDELDALKKRA